MTEEMFLLFMQRSIIAALNAIQVEELVGEREKLIAERRRRKIIGWSLIGAATIERVLTLIWPSHELYLIAAVCYLLLFGFVTWEEFRAVIRQRVVSAETISMSISVYLLFDLRRSNRRVILLAKRPLSGVAGATCFYYLRMAQ